MSNDLQQGGELKPGNGLQQGWLSLPDVFRLAECLVKAGDFIPAHFNKNVSAVSAAIMTGQELGLLPMASLRGLYVVKGKVGVSYDVMVALLRKHGYRIDWPVESNNAEQATLILTHKDGTPMQSSYTKEDAVRAGLWGKNTWAAHPKSMLRARAVSNAARAFAGEVLSGIYCIDEVKEIAEREEKVVEVKADSASGTKTLLNALEVKHDQPKEVEEDSGAVVQEVDALDDDGVLTDSFISLNDMLNEAKCADDLEVAAAQIKDSRVTDSERQILRSKYVEMKKTIGG